MTQDDNDAVASFRAGMQTLSNEHRADPLSLVLGHHGHRREGKGVDLAAPRNYGQLAEQDVADDPSLVLGDQGQPRVTFCSERLDQSSLFFPAKRQPVDLPDGGVIFTSIQTNLHLTVGR